MQVEFHSETVGDVEVFYRVAGPADAPVLLLLHGFPTASHMFRDLIPHLAGGYRVIAPDLPGFGNTKAPARDTFAYSFDHLAQVIDGFTEALHLAATRSTSSITAHQSGSAWRWPTPNGSPPSSVRTAMPTSKG